MVPLGPAPCEGVSGSTGIAFDGGEPAERDPSESEGEGARKSAMKSLPVSARRGDEVTGVTLTYAVGASVEIEVVDDEGRSFTADGPDLWNTLVVLRETLEANGIMLCCKGARADVWPSGMSGQMGDGRSAYQFTPGKRLSHDDLVDILGPTPCSEVVTVEEQVRARIARHKPAPRARRDLPLATPAEAIGQAGKIVFDFEDVYGPNDIVDFRHVRGRVPVDESGVMEDKYWPNESYERPDEMARRSPRGRVRRLQASLARLSPANPGRSARPNPNP